MDGDPIVRQIVNKLYGDDEEMLESVVISESQVIVSRETLRKLYLNYGGIMTGTRLSDQEQSEVVEVLGDA